MNKVGLLSPRILAGELTDHPVEMTAKSAERRLRLFGRRLAIPVSPLSEEGLPDLYLRAYRRNGSEFGSTIWPILDGGRTKAYFGHRNFVDLKLDNESFADFLGTPSGAEDIAPMRYTRPSPGVVSFFGAAVKVKSLAAHRRVSPRFIREFGYQKAVWSILPIAFDPSNYEVLLERCPVCDAELTFGRSLGICFCHACVNPDDPARGLVDLREFPQRVVEMDNYENLDFACSLVKPSVDTKGDVTCSLHPDLRTVGRGEVFEFIALIGRLLDEAAGMKNCASITPQSLDAATDAIRKWPIGFIDVAERIREVWRRPTYGMGRGLRHPIHGEVVAFQKFFGRNFVKLVRDQLRSGLAPNSSPAQPMDRNSRFRRPIPMTKRIGGFDTRCDDQRLELASLLARSSRKIRDEAKFVGLPLVELIAIYEKGLARCPDESVSQYLRPNRSAAGELASCINSRCMGNQDAGVSLYDSVTCLSGGRVLWSGVLEHVLAGLLSIGIVEGDAPLIRRIIVTGMDDVLNALSSSARDAWTDKVVVNNADAGFYLCLPPHEVCKVVTAGLLPLNGIEISALEKFRLMHISGAEILRCLEVNRHPTKSKAKIFEKLNMAGIRPVLRRPAVRDRNLVRDYLIGFGYTC
ncbi:hypothetical protein [Rhizobium leguminosarum]|uniref:hypothetical protein n=1 Tax=Rhizobium leguminosarum TaxID=384 RepID=UPI001C93A6A9|nr:hypothetical protein [Rhizobium leguminosarum]MBY5422343.1 hypothetical protein [Rhizobium leguminosarum]